MYNPIQPDAITLDPIAGHLSQMSNSPLDSLTGSPQPQSINSPAQGSFPPSLHSSFLNSIYSSNLNSSTHLLTSSPQPHSINSPAWESFPPSLLPSFSNSRYSLKQKPPLYLLTSSPQSQSVNSSVGSPVSEATDNQVHTVAILDICHHAGCSNELIQQAKYKSGKELREGPDKGTPARILNYLAMVEVLTKMEYGSTAMDPIQVKHYYHGTPLTGASSFQLLAGVSTPSNTKAAGSLGLSRICIGTHRCHQKVGLLSSMFVWSWLTFFSVSWGVCHMAWHWAFVEQRWTSKAEEMVWESRKNSI